MAFCSKCGASLAEGSGFCSACGTKVGAEGVSPNAGEGAARKTFGEKAKGGINKLPFRNLAEKIPAETRAKIPLLNTLIPLANYIVLGAAALFLVIAIGGGGESGSGVAHKDFIGTWALSDRSGIYTITKDEYIVTVVFMSKESKATYPIIDVTPWTNTNNNTRTNYPNGFRFNVGGAITEGEPGYISAPAYFSAYLFIHPSKNELVNIHGDVLRKQ